MFARPLSRRRVQALLTLPLMMLGAIAVLPGEASAAKWYCNPRCDYKDPATFPSGGPCADDAATVSSFEWSGRTIQLRYSHNCETAWARVYGVQHKDKIMLERDYDYGLSWEYFEDDNEWSPMLDDHGRVVRACFQLGWDSNSRKGCTGWY